MDEINQAIEAAKAELAMLQAEIATLKAKKSIVECIRETFAQAQPVSVLKRKVRRSSVEITITEVDFERLKEQARSVAWIERKLTELQQLGDRLWYKLNQAEALKAAIRRAEDTAHYYLIQTAFETKNAFGQKVLHPVTARCYYVPEYSNTVYTTYMTLDGEAVLFDEEKEDWLMGM